MIINPFTYNLELWYGGVKVDDVANMLSLSITKEQNSVGTMTFSVYVDSDFFQKYLYNTTVVLYRRSLAYGIVPYIEFMGHIVDIDPIEDDNQKAIATIMCQDFNGLLLRRKILYYPGTSYVLKGASTETIVKEFVTENIGETANSPFRFANGKLDGFIVEPDLQRGMYTEGEDKSGQSLFDTIKDLCDNAKLKFTVSGDVRGNFLFQVKQNRIGMDRTSVSLRPDGVNMYDLYPVKFNFGVGNISKVTRKIINSNRLSTVVAFGQGSDEDKEIYALSTDIESGLDIREEVVNASNDDTDGLNYVAYRRINSVPVNSYAVEVIQVPGFIYGYNYSLGDLVSFDYQDYSTDYVIESIQLSIESSGEESITITLNEESA